MGEQQRHMMWVRTRYGTVRHLRPSATAKTTLCGNVNFQDTTQLIGIPQREEDWHLPVCKTCCAVVTAAGELLAAAVARTGVQ